MSHHFDTPSAKEDPRINVCDLYLFEGAPDTTVMAMTVNPDAGLSAPETFRHEALYTFRFDSNGDAHEEISFKFHFGDVQHADEDERIYVQSLRVLRATGEEAVHGAGGETLLEGTSGKITSKQGIRAYAGTAPDLFAGDAVALHAFLTAFYKERRFNPGVFKNRQNYFARRNVSAIVLEVPSQMIGDGLTHCWATASLYGHAPEVQVSRWGLPLLTHLFINDPDKQELREDFNRSIPSHDLEKFSGHIASFAKAMTALAASTAYPDEYAKQVVARLCPATLPYRLGTHASFDRAGFNGRRLTDDAMDVMLTLATNAPLEDGVAPDKRRTRPDFPFFGDPYTRNEQEGVAPAPRPPKKG
jgi:hypothetical protein